MHRIGRSETYLDQLKQNFPKDFNQGGSDDWEHVIKQQNNIFKPDNKEAVRINTLKSQLMVANELGKQQWEKYQASSLNAKEELRMEFEQNISNQAYMQNEKQAKLEKDQYVKKFLHDNYKQKGEEKRKVQQMGQEEMRRYESDQHKKASAALKNEEAQSKYKRYVYTQEAQDIIRQKNIVKKAEEEQKELSKQEYKQM